MPIHQLDDRHSVSQREYSYSINGPVNACTIRKGHMDIDNRLQPPMQRRQPPTDSLPNRNPGPHSCDGALETLGRAFQIDAQRRILRAAASLAVTATLAVLMSCSPVEAQETATIFKWDTENGSPGPRSPFPADVAKSDYEAKSDYHWVRQGYDQTNGLRLLNARYLVEVNRRCVIAVGLGAPNDTVSVKVWKYNPATNTWKEVAHRSTGHGGSIEPEVFARAGTKGDLYLLSAYGRPFPLLRIEPHD
jgi:hypothetical protein